MTLEPWTLSRLFTQLVESGESNCIAVACMLCPKNLLDSAARLAETDAVFRRVDVCQGLSVYVVKGRGDKEYILIPGKFCSCHYFQENVVNRGEGWTCKHDLGLRLRIGIRGGNSITITTEGKNEVLKYLVQ